MIYLPKSNPGPECLESEKAKPSGKYLQDEVLMILQKDFKNKCYLCEDQPASLNVEHFIPHRGNRDLMFDWANLFLSCSYCNNIKGDRYENILNCTCQEDNVETALRYNVAGHSFPEVVVMIEPVKSDTKAETTGELLRAIYQGTTPLKRMGSANLRKHLGQEVSHFLKLLNRYQMSSDQSRTQIAIKIQEQLQSDSAFTAFKRWIIRDNPDFHYDFPPEAWE